MAELAIFLLILKIIGIVLLCIVGLILLFTITILIVPLRYKADASKHPTQAISAHIQISYFLWIFRAMADIEGSKIHSYVKLFWFYLYDSDRPMEDSRNAVARFIMKKAGLYSEESDTEEKKKSKTTKTTKAEDAGSSEAELKEANPKDKNEQASQPEAHHHTSDAQKTLDKESNMSKDGKVESTKEDSSPDLETMFEQWKKKLNQNYKKIQFHFKHMYDKIMDISKKIRYWYHILEEKYVQAFLSCVFSNLWRMFCYALPTKLQANIEFGIADNPAMMGKILMYLGCLYPLYGEHVVIIPNFEQSVFDADVSLKGHIRPGRCLYYVLRIILNRNTFKIIKLVMDQRRR